MTERKSKKYRHELWTDRDRNLGLAEKKGLEMGSLHSERDKAEGLITKREREEGLL
jgi:hypothetical protein